MEDTKIEYLTSLLESNFLQMAVILSTLAEIQSKVENKDINIVKQEIDDKLKDVRFKFKARL